MCVEECCRDPFTPSLHVSAHCASIHCAVHLLLYMRVPASFSVRNVNVTLKHRLSSPSEKVVTAK